MRINLILYISTLIISCEGKEPNQTVHTKEQIELKVEQYLDQRPNYYKDIQGWQACLDSAIQIDPNNAYLWQQKAMPYFKTRKYSLGMKYLQKAVELNPDRYLSYQAFIKCIFVKDYQDAIEDFNILLKTDPNGTVQDHPYYFYIGLCHLQLDQFESAKSMLYKSIQAQMQENGENWVHFLDYFYLGIAFYELKIFDLAIKQFDRALNEYPELSDAHYYKSCSLSRQGKTQQAKESMLKTKQYIKQGYTINDQNALYEKYPYQISKRWFGY